MSACAPDAAPSRAARWADPAALTALGALFAWLLFVTWHRWGDIVVDCGRDAYLAMRLADGDVLYRDVTSQYPPLAPYLNALLFRLFGTHLDVLYASGMVSAALVTGLCYRLGRRVVPPGEAAAIAGLLMLTCGFGPFLYNYILPATYSGLYGIILGLLTLDSLMNAEQRDARAIWSWPGCSRAWRCSVNSKRDWPQQRPGQRSASAASRRSACGSGARSPRRLSASPSRRRR